MFTGLELIATDTQNRTLPSHEVSVLLVIFVLDKHNELNNTLWLYLGKS